MLLTTNVFSPPPHAQDIVVNEFTCIFLYFLSTLSSPCPIITHAKRLQRYNLIRKVFLSPWLKLVFELFSLKGESAELTTLG